MPMVKLQSQGDEVSPEHPAENHVPDESLVESVLNGDDGAFGVLFDRHKRRMAQLAAKFFQRSERIEDVVQDIFTKLYFVLGEYSVREGSSFAAWLTRVATNVCYDQLRSARRKPESNLLELTEDEADIVHQRIHQPHSSQHNLEHRLISHDLAKKLLARLDPKDQMVLVLLEVEGLSITEIAEVTGWSASNVKVRAHRARLALRKVVEDFV